MPKPSFTYLLCVLVALLRCDPCYALRQCEVTIETFTRVPTGSPDITPSQQMNPASRFFLGTFARSPDPRDKRPIRVFNASAPANSDRWHLDQSWTLPFPESGQVRIVSLPRIEGQQVVAIELRNLRNATPDLFWLDAHGVPVGSTAPDECPTRYYLGQAHADRAHRNAFVVAVHPVGPIEQPDIWRPMELHQ